MDITEMKKLAKDVATRNKIFGWKIYFGKDDSVGATCWHDIRAIELTETFILDNAKDVCMNLILHEIAHALVGWRNHHNDVWKAKCVEIGARPFEFMNDDGFPDTIMPRHSNDFTDFFKIPELPDDQSQIVSIRREE